MRRILFWGDLAGTGFGTVTRDLGRALLDAGNDVRFVSLNELGGDLEEPFLSRTFQVTAEITDEELRAIYGTSSLSILNERITGLFDGTLWRDGWKPEAQILLGDYWAVEATVLVNEVVTRAFASVPTYHYIPVEGIDLPPAWRRLWNVVRPVAMSEFGADEIWKILGKRPPVVYHGVDTEAFHPVSERHPIRVGDRVFRSKEDCKAAMFHHPHHTDSCPENCHQPITSWAEAKRIGGSFRWIFRADRNMPRKRYPSLLRAITPTLLARGDAMLVLHCRVKLPDEGGRLADSISKVPQPVRERIIGTGWHDQESGAPRGILTVLYNAADVYVTVSAEGFGLTPAESMACGVPVVALDYSAVSEVVGDAGVLVPPVGSCKPDCHPGFHRHGLVDNPYDHFWSAVDEQRFGIEVGSLLDDPERRRRLGAAGIERVRSMFSWKAAGEGFSGIIEEGM